MSCTSACRYALSPVPYCACSCEGRHHGSALAGADPHEVRRLFVARSEVAAPAAWQLGLFVTTPPPVRTPRPRRPGRRLADSAARVRFDELASCAFCGCPLVRRQGRWHGRVAERDGERLVAHHGCLEETLREQPGVNVVTERGLGEVA